MEIGTYRGAYLGAWMSRTRNKPDLHSTRPSSCRGTKQGHRGRACRIHRGRACRIHRGRACRIHRGRACRIHRGRACRIHRTGGRLSRDLYAGVALEVGFDVLFGVVDGYGEALCEAEGALPVDDAEVDGLPCPNTMVKASVHHGPSVAQGQGQGREPACGP